MAGFTMIEVSQPVMRIDKYIRSLFALAVIGIVSVPRTGHSVESIQGTVTYATSRSVYVQFDKSVSASAGDTLQAGMSPDTLAPVTVRSVSTRKVVLERNLLLADASAGKTVFVILPAQQIPPVTVGTAPADRTGMPPVPLDGRITAQYYRYRGDNGGIEYDQPSYYVDLQAGGTVSSPLELVLRFRSRLQRELTMPDGKNTSSERTDRFYDLSFAWRGSSFTAVLGRTRRIMASGMGGLDGLVLEKKAPGGLTLGVFTGIAPELDNFIGDRREQKQGAYLNWDPLSDNNLDIIMTASYIDEQHSEESSTRLLYLGSDIRYSRRLFFSGETAVNLNPQGAGRDAETIQNVRAYFSWAAHDRVRLTMSYAGYLVQEYRDLNVIVDPLTELRYALAHTFLPRIELSLPFRTQMSGEVLVGNDPLRGVAVLSAGIRSRISNIAGSKVTAGLSFVRTELRVGSGNHVLVDLSRAWGATQLSLDGSLAVYEHIHTDRTINPRLQASLFRTAGKSLYASAQYTRAWDKSLGSNTFFVELGWRFRNNQ
jgi:hypothetical protein